MSSPGNPPDHPAYEVQTLTGEDAKDNPEILKRCAAGMEIEKVIQPTNNSPARLIWGVGY